MNNGKDTAAIRKMLDSVTAEIRELEDRLDVLQERELTLTEWLKEETPQQAALSMDMPAAIPPLHAFFLGLVRAQPMNIDQLAEAAAEKGLIGRRKSPKRVANIVLQTLRKYDLVKKTGENWAAKKQI